MTDYFGLRIANLNGVEAIIPVPCNVVTRSEIRDGEHNERGLQQFGKGWHVTPVGRLTRR